MTISAPSIFSISISGQSAPSFRPVVVAERICSLFTLGLLRIYIGTFSRFPLLIILPTVTYASHPLTTPLTLRPLTMTHTRDITDIPLSDGAASSTTPIVSKRRSQKSLATSKAHQALPPTQANVNDMPLQARTSSSDEEKDSDGEHEQAHPVLVEDAKRTVRRKKSSLDLRDVFLHGDILPSQPS